MCRETPQCGWCSQCQADERHANAIENRELEIQSLLIDRGYCPDYALRVGERFTQMEVHQQIRWD